MTELHRPHGSLTNGSDPVVLTAEQAAWDYCGLHVVKLDPSEERTVSLEGVEAGLVPLAGSCRVEVGGTRFELAGRTSVFGPVTDVLYAPRGSDMRIFSERGGEFAVATAATEMTTELGYVAAEDVPVTVRGRGQASRQITELLGPASDLPANLIVVEVITPGGNWSSYPPHKHDEHSGEEVPLEEIYYFRIDGDAGFGMHRTYTQDGTIDVTVTVHDGDVFLVPRGYHGPCAAAPGYHMYYLNVMGGPADERAWKVQFDDRHEWVMELWNGFPADPRLPLTGDA